MISFQVTSLLFLIAVNGPTYFVSGTRPGSLLRQRRIEAHGGGVHEDESTLEHIQEHGKVLCGAAAQSPGFSVKNEDGTFSGFEVDLCSALAAAALGDATKYEIVETTSATRFTDLQAGAFDVLIRTTTHNMQRDVSESSTSVGFSFSKPYFYDGLKFAGISPYGECADTVDTTSDGCAGLRICISEFTSWYPVTQSLFPQEMLVPVEDSALYASMLESGECNAIGGETGNIIYPVISAQGFTGAEADFYVGSSIHSKEPLAMVTRQDDAQWSDFVYWTLEGLMTAEERGVGIAGADAMGVTSYFGEGYQNMFKNAVAAAGNYGEIYRNHLEVIAPRAGLNTLSTDNSPKQYPHPGVP